MTNAAEIDKETRNGIRALRGARRYIPANKDALAQTYARIANLDPARRSWAEH